MRINRTFQKMLESAEGQQVLALARRRRRELIAVASVNSAPVQILADDVAAILPTIVKPKPGHTETAAARRVRYRQRQFVGAVVGAVMDENGWQVKRQGGRIPSDNPVFSVGSTFRRKPERSQ